MTHPGSSLRTGLGVVALAAMLIAPAVVPDRYLLHVATLIGTYWILIVGLNLIVGYMGQLSVGHVGLFAIGAYTMAICGQRGVPPELALPLAGAIGAVCGFVLGLPSLRLPGFYFAMTTLGLSLIVGEMLVAQRDLTGGGGGIAVSGFNGALASPAGFYGLVAVVGAAVTFAAWNIARMMWGRALVSIRDSAVAAAAVGVPSGRVKLTVFTFSGFTAGLAGALFGALQTFISPDTFHFDLGLFFFICIVIGGKGSILGPFIGTVVLTVLPELFASFAILGNFMFAVILLAVVLLVPEGMSAAVRWVRERIDRRRPAKERSAPDLVALTSILKEGHAP